MTEETLSTPDQNAFVAALRGMVIDDSAAQEARVQSIWNEPLADRLEKGYAIDRVRIVPGKPGKMIEVAWEENNSLFREGDILCLHRGDPKTRPSCTVNLEFENESGGLLAPLNSGLTEQEIRDTPEGWILDIGFFNLSERYITALSDAVDSETGRDRVLPVLMGEKQSEQRPKDRERAESVVDSLKLNWSQSEAFVSGFATDTFYLVQGPPGTGKTHVLAALVGQFVAAKQHVLVTALTHKAINNALNKIRKVHGEDFPVCKIGLDVQAKDLEKVENYDTFGDSPFVDRLNHDYAVGATPFAVRSPRLAGVDFDVVIFDEASQITMPLAIMAMLAGQRYIFIGDDKQLPPVLSIRPNNPDLARSVFEIVRPKAGTTMLTETYRMNDSLAKWPSRAFYHNRLKPHKDAIDRRLELSDDPLIHGEVLDPNSPLVFVQVPTFNRATTHNQREADLAVELIAELLRRGVPPRQIAVVTLFRKQGRRIRDGLRRNPATRETKDIADLEVDTVERMQGQERDVILFSLTSTSVEFVRRLAGFYFDPRRLNVSITRARRKLIVLGGLDLDLVSGLPEAEREGLELMRDFLASCKRVNQD